MTDTQLPDGWQWVKLGNVCQIRGGKRLPKGASFATRKTPYPYLRVIDFDSGTINEADLRYLDESTHQQIARYIINRNDVYISIAGTIGIVGLIPDHLDGAHLTENAARLIIQDTALLDRDYLSLVLQSSWGQEPIRARTNLVGQPKLALERIATIQIPLPPLPEQHRIAAIVAERMAAVEQARLAAQAQLEAAELLTAAYLRAVFESEEAQGWGVVRLGDIASTASGTTPLRSRNDYYDGGKICWVKTGELHDRDIENTEEHVTELALRETSLKVLPPDTLLIAMYGQGQTRGRTGLLKIPATTNQACFAILPNPSAFDTSYLQWWFRYSYKRLREETEGRGGNQPNLNGQVLNEQGIPLPPITIQREISTSMIGQMQQVNRVRAALQHQLDLINQLPSAILRRAFSGEI